MDDTRKTKKQLLNELEEMRQSISELKRAETERKQAEEALPKTTEYLENLISYANAPIIVWDADNKITRFNKAFERITGRNVDDVVGKKINILFPKDKIDESLKYIQDTSEGVRWETVEISIQHIDGTIKAVLWNSANIYSSDNKTVIATIAQGQDITKRKQAEEVLKEYSQQLETLNTVTATLSTSLELDHVLELILDQIEQVMPLDSGAIFLHEEGKLRVVADHGITPLVKGIVFTAEDNLFREIQQTQKPLILDNPIDDPRFQNWGQSTKVKSWMGIPLIVRDTLIGFLTLDCFHPDAYSPEQADLAFIFASQAAQAIENARQFGVAQRRLKRMDSLLEIDRAIAGSLDLNIILNILLENLLTQLEVDAVVVLLFEKTTQGLTFSHGKGFRTAALQYTDLRLGQGYAGEVALQRHHVFIPDLNQAEPKFQESPQFSKEGFVSYYGVPLIAKGKLVGVLEIFHRSPLDPGDEWVNYLRLLANLTAIAIENGSLFTDLQRSHLDLTLAYDATIEGWAHALELKDLETEGHSRRVVEMTTDLARRMGNNEKNLTHIRRGALLHDIGKMGIPDSILQKPGKLTNEERKIMMQHPTYAFEWLSQIEYLRPALEIPYAHHEKWDGSGYPLGLEGDQIPLAARIFAIVDVWDALTSDRPYRKAWSKKKALTYIQEQSGKYFDPQVVAVFLEYIRSQRKI